MVHVLRAVRRELSSDGRFRHYLVYAAGEIVLVVLGILIALQINNWNSARQDRARERVYLANIRSDLVEDVADMNRYLAIRKERIAAAERILKHFNGDPITDPSAFNADGISIYSWQRYYLGNNTYQEMVSSGNFALLSNSDIKKRLLNIEALYAKLKSEEDHYRFDTETTLYRPLYDRMDTEAMIADAQYRSTGGRAGRPNAVTAADFEPMLRSKTMKNGFMMTILEYGTMNEQMAELRERCKALIATIDAELDRQ